MEAKVAKHTIDKDLYETAVSQIAAQLDRESPVSSEIKRMMAQGTRENAQNMFGNAWATVHKMQDDQEKHIVSRRPAVLEEYKSSGTLSPETEERMKKRWTDRQALFQEDIDKKHEAFDQHHRKVLIGSFTRPGVDQSTAEKIVDEYVLGRKK